jgi:hypothetical protein
VRPAGRVAFATALLLLLPLLAMLFTDRIAWGPGDFAIAGLLLFGAGLAYEFAKRKEDSFAYRAATGVAVAAALLLVWFNLAVGLIGAEDNPANLMYLGVLAVGATGAYLARWRSQGMALALLATALAQALVGAIAGGFALGAPGTGPRELILLNGIFVVLFIGSAWLFRLAARQRA